MYDLFFVSYDEPNAEENYAILKARFPHTKRMHGIEGIGNAHKACAKQAFTSMFWTVDGDTIVDDDWDFSYDPPVWDKKYLHLWYSRNPVNSLVYGYGAVKLWPRELVLKHEGSWLDFTGSVGSIKLVNGVIATTRFNTTPYEAWKSAFRECVKLCENITMSPEDDESKERLKIWTSEHGSALHAAWCVQGAVDAVKWHRQNRNNLSDINDFRWLKAYHAKLYQLQS